jgi:glutamine synthetase
MIRVPDSGRFELRLMDGAANAYLMQAAILACGLDGVAANRDPGEPLDINMYELGKDLEGYKQLPRNLLDALRLLDNSDVLRERMGNNLIDSYVKMKKSQWDDHSSHLTQWERDHTLDC